MPASTGANTSLHFQQESSFGDGGDGTDKIFGADQTLETAEVTNNGTRIYMPGSNRSVEIKEGTFDGSWSVSFDLSTPDFLYALFGSISTGTYSGDPAPIAIHAGDETTGSTRVLEGCVASSCSVAPSVDENTVPITLEGFYTSESQDSSFTSQTGLSNDVYDYADASLSLGGTTEGIVQNASLDLTAATEPINEFGTRFATDFMVGPFEPTVNFSKIKQDENNAENVYGGSTSTQENITTDSAVTLDFSKGGNSITFTCEATFPESYNVPYGDPSATVEEEINRQITDVTVDVVTA